LSGVTTEYTPKECFFRFCPLGKRASRVDFGQFNFLNITFQSFFIHLYVFAVIKTLRHIYPFICTKIFLYYEGAEVFFPDAEARRDHLLSLVEKVMEESKAVSLSYTFESLCRFFSNKDASGLLGLPEYLPQVSYIDENTSQPFCVSVFIKCLKDVLKMLCAG